MVDVNKSVKLLESMMVEGISTNKFSEFINILDQNKPIIYRGLNEKTLLNVLNNHRAEFIKIINNLNTNVTNPILKIGSDDNSKGADAEYGDYDIEMKFGGETNANIGRDVFNDIFPLSDSIFDYFSLENRNYRKGLYVNNDYSLDDIYKHNQIAYQNIANAFNLVYNNLNNSQVLKVNNIIARSGSVNIQNDNKYIKVLFYKNKVEVVPSIKPQTRYSVRAVATENHTNSRLTIYVENNNLEIKFVFNCKNNIKVVDDSGNTVKLPSKTMLGSTSFNVFVKVKQ